MYSSITVATIIHGHFFPHNRGMLRRSRCALIFLYTLYFQVNTGVSYLLDYVEDIYDGGRLLALIAVWCDDLIITILPVVTKDLPISPRFTPYSFLSRCKLSTLTTRQPKVEFYLLTFPRFPLRKKEHKSYFGIIVELTTSALAGVQVTY